MAGFAALIAVLFAVLGGLQVFGVLGLVLGAVVVAMTLALIEMAREAADPRADPETNVIEGRQRSGNEDSSAWARPRSASHNPAWLTFLLRAHNSGSAQATQQHVRVVISAAFAAHWGGSRFAQVLPDNGAV